MQISDMEEQFNQKSSMLEHSSEGNRVNMDLLQENANLRQNMDKLKHKLKSVMGYEYDGWITCVEPYHTNQATRAMQEVDRILNVGNEPSAKAVPLLIDQGLQTGPDPFELRIVELESMLRETRNGYEIETGRNKKLASSLDSVRIETESISETLTRLTNDLHISKASERILKLDVESTSQIAKQLDIQNQGLAKELKAAKSVLEGFSQAKTVIQNMAHPGTKTKVKPGELNDPMSLVEYQWLIDRERFVMEVQVYKSQIASLESDKRILEREMKERLSKMYSASDWTLLTAKHSLAVDQIKRNNEELRTRATCISMLEADVSKSVRS